MRLDIKKFIRFLVVMFAIVFFIIFSIVKLTVKKDKEKKVEVSKNIISVEESIVKETADYYKYMERVNAKGVYISDKMVAYNINPYIDLANTTEVNAFVIDVKADHGYLTFDADQEVLKDIGIDDVRTIRNIDVVMDKLRENDIYPIARVVAFKDDYIKKEHPEWMLKKANGEMFTTTEPGGATTTWMNPYNEKTWDYICTVAEEAIRVGFKEIQFDYVRFHESTRTKDMNYQNSKGLEKTEIIASFTEYAAGRLKKQGAYVAADVFGAAITSKYDADSIGQNYKEMAKHLDYICPMIYPSHYRKGVFGVNNDHPDKYPYKVIYGALEASNKALEGLEKKAIVRPWLQGFTASYLGPGNYKRYGKTEINEQKQASYDNDVTEWMFWNSRNSYKVENFEKR